MVRDAEFDFFIAHASADSHAAQRLFELLSPESKVFLDSKCLEPGDNWPTVIQDAQRNSRTSLVLISDTTERAFYEIEEIAAAISLARQTPTAHRVIPIYLSGHRPGNVPYGLRQKHGLEVTESTPIEQVAARLLAMRRASSTDPAQELPDLPTARALVLERAERVARTLADPGQRARALWTLAQAVADDDPQRFCTLIDTATLDICSMNPEHKLDWLLEDMAAAAAPLDLNQAEKTAYTIIEADHKAAALAAVAAAARGIDTARAVKILGDADDIARTITSTYPRDTALAKVSLRLFACDPNRGERAARAITDPGRRATALANLAEAATSDPQRAARLLADANRIARDDPSEDARVAALVGIAGSFASRDAERASQILVEAENVARAIQDPWWRSSALQDIAATVYSYDPDRAESAAKAITHLRGHRHPLEDIAYSVLPFDSQRAERIARSLPTSQLQCLLRIARSVAADDPDHAERIARSLPSTDPYWKLDLLALVAATVIAYDPGRARDLLTEIERDYEEIEDARHESRVLAKAGAVVFTEDPDWSRRLFNGAEELAQSSGSTALKEVTKAIAATDPARAERIAESFAGTPEVPQVSRGIVEAAAVPHADQAERIADAIGDPQCRFEALMAVANARRIIRDTRSG